MIDDFRTSPPPPTGILEDKFYFPDLPDGPLTEYRKKATFDYKKMALLLEDEDSYKLKVSYVTLGNCIVTIYSCAKNNSTTHFFI